jgi:mono/diheme cytochrome c family protein
MRRRIVHVCTMAIIAAVVVWGGVVRARQQVPVAPVFTAQQASAGKTAYAKNCASCHMPDLSGNAEIPALAGTAFMTTWGARTTKELFDYMSAAMPYGAPSLSVEAYTTITAHILQSNGAVAGDEALTASTAVRIGSLKVPTPAQ